MKNKSWKNKFVMLSILVAVVTINSEVVTAIEGETPVQGEITLIEDSAEQAQSSESEKPKPPSTDERHKENPKGRFPSTGELIKNSLSVGGLLLILIVYLVRRKMRRGGSVK